MKTNFKIIYSALIALTIFFLFAFAKKSIWKVNKSNYNTLTEDQKLYIQEDLIKKLKKD